MLGTFAGLNRPIGMEVVEFAGNDTGYRAVTVLVRKAQVHYYRIGREGRFYLDPINPQRATWATGRVWSRFFTDGYLQPIVLETWEVRLLYRLMEQILPFRNPDSENFLKRYYFGLNREQRKNELPKVFRLDESVGEVNAVDKLLAREEAHRLIDYKLCLRQIVRALRAQNPYLDPSELPAEDYVQLYEAMAASRNRDRKISGWDYDEYADPSYFLYVLRRHAVTAAFGHPRYAGNVGAAGWAYLEERYSDPVGTLFDWRAALEAPLGTSPHYR
ncbi:hypothetical protein [Aurantimonas sp. 22II-16-19i]|uniref:hypothetical protein n=1 Tax=Aurantimonas sp. 22II-16-19i TaxID=1317114 RepID=UPI0009F7FF6A|nr:hypothetical protein [Aurantimonas sp. 22II-16-19i]ORE86533.1 hypothetical protein ATO4_25950 [Aurantimonas sp. 22II-16-19i]